MIEQHITDLIGEVAKKTAEKLGKDIFFTYGSVSELITKLSIMSKYKDSAEKKYPLIALFTDIEEKRGVQVNIQSEVIIQSIIFATFTSKDYHSEERMENSIKSILHPIYQEFLEQLKRSGYFLIVDSKLIPHTKINRLSWGKSAIFTANNLGTDYIDAIEITNLNLKIKTKIC